MSVLPPKYLSCQGLVHHVGVGRKSTPTSARADDKEAAIAELVKLCKGQHKIGTVQDYTVKFNAIAARTSFSAEDKRERYRTGLPYKIKDILATSGHDTSSITKIQAVALTMDQNLLVREEERPKQFSGGWRKKGEKAAATGKKPFTGNCFNCGKPGHRSFECKLPRGAASSLLVWRDDGSGCAPG
ncbi:transcription factor [Ganoderma sinense ZZ0214-1]|uniref:Transcription factor n=1 Tax=Ganoderma sinense ZZ0214-1 TaxID=1077348 RepID=A0A2G8S570_9APHY|nr:transcription factor [Ganoderma sinense ZZ0214-1]